MIVLFATLVSLVGISFWFYKKFKRYPCGYTISQVKKILETKTNCGKYGNIKSRAHVLKGTVEIVMSGVESIIYDLYTGNGWSTDEDFDGCMTNSFPFKIGKSNIDDKLTILRGGKELI